MPKVFITQEQRQLEHIYNYIKAQCHIKKISQALIASELGITQQAYSYKLRSKTLSLEDFVVIMNILGKDVEVCTR
jgi:transcriptional regulator with XRE-family HTH domain